jgi:HSP20 family molecular chaperone IbpA
MISQQAPLRVACTRSHTEARQPQAGAHSPPPQGRHGSITIEAELPGVEEKDVTVTLANVLLTIKGGKKQEKEEKGASYELLHHGT